MPSAPKPVLAGDPADPGLPHRERRRGERIGHGQGGSDDRHAAQAERHRPGLRIRMWSPRSYAADVATARSETSSTAATPVREVRVPDADPP